jgi:acyl-CoA thioesterase-1
MGSDMDGGNLLLGLFKPANRRRCLLDCSLLALALAAAGPASAQPKDPKREPLILVLGDSLSAEYGLARGTGWVALLQQRLADQKIAASVVNASISGDTTSGGRSRLPQLLKQHQPAWVLIELGANDALRGLPLTLTHDNLSAMTRAAKASGAKVMLLGMQLPPNYGRRYTDDFAALYPAVAKAEGTALVPFLLAGVADAPDAATRFQADGIHPLASQHPHILDNVWAVLKPLLAR